MRESYTKSGSCFPKTATVQLITEDENNFKELLIEDLQIGDEIMAYDLEANEMILDEVIGFLHKEIGVNSDFLLIKTEKNSLEITPTHIIFIKNET